jgi:preprotein translocase subunit SecE
MTQPMNRETKRMLQRQGSINADGTPVPQERRPASVEQRDERTPLRQVFREVRVELKKVVWPTKPEVINYTTVTVVMLLIVTAAVFAFDFVSSKGIYRLFR